MLPKVHLNLLDCRKASGSYSTEVRNAPNNNVIGQGQKNPSISPQAIIDHG